jgi:hypothetical protein
MLTRRQQRQFAEQPALNVTQRPDHRVQTGRADGVVRSASPGTVDALLQNCCGGRTLMVIDAIANRVKRVATGWSRSSR